MAEVNTKYLKDENGDIISPIIGSDSVKLGGGDSLGSNVITYKTLWSGSQSIPSYSSKNKSYVYLNDSINKYNALIFGRYGRCLRLVQTNANKFAINSSGWGVAHLCANNWENERLNIFLMWFSFTDEKTMSIWGNNCLSIFSTGESNCSAGYTGSPLTSVIGITFN